MLGLRAGKQRTPSISKDSIAALASLIAAHSGMTLMRPRDKDERSSSFITFARTSCTGAALMLEHQVALYLALRM